MKLINIYLCSIISFLLISCGSNSKFPVNFSVKKVVYSEYDKSDITKMISWYSKKYDDLENDTYKLSSDGSIEYDFSMQSYPYFNIKNEQFSILSPTISSDGNLLAFLDENISLALPKTYSYDVIVLDKLSGKYKKVFTSGKYNYDNYKDIERTTLHYLKIAWHPVFPILAFESKDMNGNSNIFLTFCNYPVGSDEDFTHGVYPVTHNETNKIMYFDLKWNINEDLLTFSSLKEDKFGVYTFNYMKNELEKWNGSKNCLALNIGNYGDAFYVERSGNEYIPKYLKNYKTPFKGVKLIKTKSVYPIYHSSFASNSKKVAVLQENIGEKNTLFIFNPDEDKITGNATLMNSGRLQRNYVPNGKIVWLRNNDIILFNNNRRINFVRTDKSKLIPKHFFSDSKSFLNSFGLVKNYFETSEIRFVYYSHLEERYTFETANINVSFSTKVLPKNIFSTRIDAYDPASKKLTLTRLKAVDVKNVDIPLIKLKEPDNPINTREKNYILEMTLTEDDSQKKFIPKKGMEINVKWPDSFPKTLKNVGIKETQKGKEGGIRKTTQ